MVFVELLIVAFELFKVELFVEFVELLTVELPGKLLIVALVVRLVIVAFGVTVTFAVIFEVEFVPDVVFAAFVALVVIGITVILTKSVS